MSVPSKSTLATLRFSAHKLQVEARLQVDHNQTLHFCEVCKSTTTSRRASLKLRWASCKLDEVPDARWELEQSWLGVVFASKLGRLSMGSRSADSHASGMECAIKLQSLDSLLTCFCLPSDFARFQKEYDSPSDDMNQDNFKETIMLRTHHSQRV